MIRQKGRSIAVVAVALLLITSGFGGIVGPAVASPSGDSPPTDEGANETVTWRSIQFGNTNTGHAPNATGPESPVGVAWNYSAGKQYTDYFVGVDSSASVVDGVVYVGGGDGDVHAVNASAGQKIWNYSTGAPVRSSTTVVNGTVYVGSDDDNIYALNASTGQKVWNYSTGDDVDQSPTVANDTVYVGSDDGDLYALNASTGQRRWNAPV
jgi:outer membrane protein assembly factor BamB